MIASGFRDTKDSAYYNDSGGLLAAEVRKVLERLNAGIVSVRIPLGQCLAVQVGALQWAEPPL
jgi:hypothetical protein